MATYHFNNGANTDHKTPTSSAIKNMNAGYKYGYGTGSTEYTVSKNKNNADSSAATPYTSLLINNGDISVERVIDGSSRGYKIQISNVQAYYQYNWAFSSVASFVMTLSCGTVSRDKELGAAGLYGQGAVDMPDPKGSFNFIFDSQSEIDQFNKDSVITISLCHNIRNISGTNGGNGPTWFQIPKANLRELFCTFELHLADLPDLQLKTGEKPSNLTVTNNKPRTSPSENSAVSQYTNAINLKWSATADPTCDTVSYRYKKSSADTWGSWHNTAVSANSGTINIDSLSSGTNYNIEVKCSNDEGTSSTVSKTIRTLYDPPTLTVTLTEALLERLKFHVKSNRALSKLTYSRTNTNGSGSTPDGFSSGDSEVDITLYDLNMRCKTQYTIYVIGTSTDTYDRRAMTSAASCRGTTLDSNKLQAVSAIEHDDTNTNGVPIKITVNSTPTGMKLTVTVGKYTKTQTITSNTTSANIPLDWDAIYKEYGKNNSVTAKFSLLTNSTNYIDDTDMNASDKAKYISEQTTTITLKGKQKTAHVGVNNAPKRVRVWVGDSSGNAKRAVTWVGTPSGTTNRTI